MGNEQDGWADGDEGIAFIDEASVVLIEDAPEDLDEAKTRVWIRPYAGR